MLGDANNFRKRLEAPQRVFFPNENPKPLKPVEIVGWYKSEQGWVALTRPAEGPKPT